jgi:hypothetical protein
MDGFRRPDGDVEGLGANERVRVSERTPRRDRQFDDRWFLDPDNKRWGTDRRTIQTTYKMNTFKENDATSQGG